MNADILRTIYQSILSVAVYADTVNDSVDARKRGEDAQNDLKEKQIKMYMSLADLLRDLENAGISVEPGA
jgi:hypothetical protein